MKRIVFIETKSSHIHVYSSVHIPRLGSVLLGTLLKQHGYHVDVFIEEIAPVDFEIVRQADLVGISTLTSTAPHSYQLAKEIRELGIPVVLGGTHVTFVPDEGLDHADFVLRGEVDETLVDFVHTLESKGDFSKIRGLSYWQDGQKVHNPNQPAPLDLDRNPIPDFQLVHGMKKMRVASISTSRGCPFDCSFCSVTTFNGKQFRTHSVERVLEEIEFHSRRNKLRFLFFADDIFNWNRKRTKDIVRGMIEHKLTPPWGAQVRHEASRDPELMELFREANCNRVYVGFESINQKTLDLYNKRETKQNVIDTIHAFHNHNVKVHGMFVLGSDEDSVETIRETSAFAKEHDIDSIQYMVLTPMPGSRDYDHFIASKRTLLTKDWSLYDGHHVVHVPRKMTSYELQVESYKAMKEFYSKRRIIGRALRGDWLECYLRWSGNQTIKQWYKQNKDYVKQLKQDLLQTSRRWLPELPKSLWNKRIAITADRENSPSPKILETFFKEMGVNVISFSDRFSSFLERSQKYWSENEKAAKESINKYSEKLREDADVIIVFLQNEIGSVSSKLNESFDNLSKSIQDKVLNLPNIIHLKDFDLESVRDHLTALGLMFSDDLLKISRARDKALAAVSLA